MRKTWMEFVVGLVVVTFIATGVFLAWRSAKGPQAADFSAQKPGEERMIVYVVAKSGPTARVIGCAPGGGGIPVAFEIVDSEYTESVKAGEFVPVFFVRAPESGRLNLTGWMVREEQK